MKKATITTVVILLTAFLLSAFIFPTAAGDDNATAGDGSAHAAAEGFGWYNYNEYLYKVSLYVGKSDTVSKQSSLLNDFYRIGTVIVKKTGWTVSESVMFGSSTKAEYYSGTPMTQLENPLIISDANCPPIPIVTLGDIDIVKQYFGSTGTMNTLLNAVAAREGTTAYGLLNNKTFTIGGTTKTGWQAEYLLPNGTANRVPWVIVYEPMVVLHLKDRVNMVAFTATEFAIAYENGWYDWYYNYGQGQAVQSLTFKHLPSSIQLEESWFGYPVYPTYDDTHIWPTQDIIKGGGWGMRWLGANGADGKDLSCEVIEYDPSPVVENAVKHVIRWYNNKSTAMTALCEIYSGDYLVVARTLSIPGNSYVTTTHYLTYHSTVTHKINARINYANRYSETDPNNNMSTVTVIPRSSANPAKDYGCWFGTVETPEADGYGLVTVTWRNYKQDFGTVLCELYRDDVLVWSGNKSLEGYESLTEAYSVYYPGSAERTLTARINYEFRNTETDPNDNMRQTKVRPTVPIDDEYDFSVSNITVTPSEVYQGETVTVSFVSDSWNRDLEYDDIPVELLVSGEVIAIEHVQFSPYGRNTHSFTVRLDGDGTQTVAARINWENRYSESNATNNYVETSALVKPYYEFSVSELEVAPETANRNEEICISFKTENGDGYNAYENIPVQLVYDGKVVYTGYFGYAAHESKTFTLTLNVGGTPGEHSLYARINWQDHLNEVDPDNNETDAKAITVTNYGDLRIEAIEPNAPYREGLEVVTSFRIYNDSDTAVTPADGNTVSFRAYYKSGVSEITISSQDWEQAVIPAEKSNLVWFKWKVPSSLAGKTVFIEATVNAGNSVSETAFENNTDRLEEMIAGILSSQTPDTHYEREKPADYATAATPAVSSGRATWSVWEYKNGGFAQIDYGIRISQLKPELTPDPNDPSAEFKDGKWIMKSGYGFSISLGTVLETMNGYAIPSTNDHTDIQSAYVRLPEFGYSTSTGTFRTLEKSEGKWQFVSNPATEGNARIHFTPLWFPDGDYTIYVSASDFWTPAGMITATVNCDTITIQGSAYDDWFLGR